MTQTVKNIILLSDGTGNAASKVWRTNVWRFFQALDLTNSRQVASYDDGVGTSAFKPLAMLGGAFGWGLKRNVLDLYKFLCRNYDDGCRIYGLGFSRGAFTIRVVMGVVVSQGVVRFESESDLHRRAKAAYRAYRRERYHSILRIEKFFRAVRDSVVAVKNWMRGHRPCHKDENIHPDTIRFIGVWDTVAAYGLPIEEMTHGVSKWIWPLEFRDRTLSKRIERACHALALDDERTTFHPVLWTEEGEVAAAPGADGKKFVKDERLSQVWFAGAHSNVGGGYPDDSLAHVALYWMMQEAQHCGMRFKSEPGDKPGEPSALRQIRLARDKDGRLYESRPGLGGYYRYGPRKLEQLCDARFSNHLDDAVRIEVPKVHESVFDRGLHGAHPYAPIGLPARYAMVADTGEIVEGGKNPYETREHAERRADGQEHVWNLVWWRRVVYFATVAASLHLALFPLLYGTERSAEFSTRLRAVSELIRLADNFLPNFFSWWLNSFATNPGRFLVGTILVAALIWIGVRLGASIRDNMKQIWWAPAERIPALPSGGVYALRTSSLYKNLLWALKRHIVPAVSVLALLYGGVTLASHFLFHVQDSAGLYCKESANIQGVPWLQEVTVQGTFRAADFCWATGIYLVEGRRYLVTVRQTSSQWKDASPISQDGFQTDLAGFEVSEATGLGNRVVLFLGVPLRRVFLRPWFRIVARVGAIGTDEYFLDPDKPTVPYQDTATELDSAFRIRRSGELFLYVNDAAIGVPGIADFFYRGNAGEATVTIKHLTR